MSKKSATFYMDEDVKMVLKAIQIHNDDRSALHIMRKLTHRSKTERKCAFECLDEFLVGYYSDIDDLIKRRKQHERINEIRIRDGMDPVSWVE